jgi:hypothetical protein
VTTVRRPLLSNPALPGAPGLAKRHIKEKYIAICTYTYDGIDPNTTITASGNNVIVLIQYKTGITITTLPQMNKDTTLQSAVGNSSNNNERKETINEYEYDKFE